MMSPAKGISGSRCYFSSFGPLVCIYVAAMWSRSDGGTVRFQTITMKINFFNSENYFYSLRWYIVVFVLIAGLMAYADLSGMRMLAGSEGQQWNSKGSASHK